VSAWTELRDLGLVVRPPDSPLPPVVGRRSLFSAAWMRTVEMLWTELRALDAKAIALELDVEERDLRLDGFPRADAHVGSSVRLSFTSKWGPLRYETAEFDSWQDNIRAIALSMEALRAVDRYGVSKRGEQYRGWRAIPMTTGGADSIATREQAEAFLGQWDGNVREALRRTHPDLGGDRDEYEKVIRARELVGA